MHAEDVDVKDTVCACLVFFRKGHVSACLYKKIDCNSSKLVYT